MPETQLASMFIGSADDGDGIDRGRPSDAGNMIHIINPQTSEILDYITLDNIIDDTHKKSLESYIETYDAIVLGGDDFSYDKHLEKRNHIIIPDEDGTYQEFVLFEVDKYRDTEGRKTHFYAHATYLELKKAKVIYPTRREGFTLSQHAGWALNNTGWRVGIVEAEGTRTFNIENHTNPYEFIKRLANEFEVEIRFRVEHDGRRITARYIDFLERIGDWKGREVEFGKDLDSIRRVEKQDIVTALLGLGPERDDGTRIEVLVTDEEALQRWGRVDEHGNLHHLIEPYEIQSERTEMTEEEARQYTRTALDKRINTQVTYETTILDLEEVPGLEHEKIRFGDTIRIKDVYFNPPLYLEARVFEMERSIKNKAKKDIKLGDYIEYTEEEVHAIWRQLRNQIRRRITAAQLVEYAEPKKVESNTPPPIKEGENPIWVDTSKTPHVPHVVIANEWVKMSPTEAQEVGAETPQGAQEKADTAEQNAKSYTDIIKSDLEDGIQQAQTTADGKNSVFTQPTAPPTTGRKIGDIWFDTSRDNLMHRFDGTQWVEAKWGERSLAAESVTALHIKSLEGLNVNDQFIVDSNGNVKFAGRLEGARGSFISEGTYDWVEIDGGIWVESPDYRTEISSTGLSHYNKHSDVVFRHDFLGMSIENSDGIPAAAISLSETGRLVLSAIVGDREVKINAQQTNIEGSVSATGQLTLYNRGVNNGLALEGVSGQHYIVGGVNTGAFFIYPHRESGDNIFTIRSHENRSNYRNDFWIDSNGDTHTNGDLRVETGNIWGKGLWDITTGNSANARIGTADSDGYSRLLRSTSSKRYKVFIEDADVDPYRILNLKPKSWIDKGEYERNGNSIEGLARHYGIIAEDMEEIGLPEYVEYHNGKVENIVERAWTLLIPIVKDLNDEVKNLKERLERLENEGN